MMQVVLMLAGAENGGTGNLVVIVLGNIIVCGMEGLVVGIQVLPFAVLRILQPLLQGETEENSSLMRNYNRKKYGSYQRRKKK